jgi:gliding motility-associated-like protein
VLYDSIDDNSLKSYTDIATPENHKYNYNYFMRAVNKCGKLGPTSDTLGTFDQLEALPKLQKLVTVTVENNSSLRVIWPKNNEKDFSQFLLYKGLLNQPASEFKLLYQTRVRNDTNYLDASVLVDKQSYCYYLNIKDTCGNYSPMGKPSCSILLQGLSNPFESKLTWNPYIYWDAGIETNVLYRRDTETPYKIVQMPDASISSALDKDLNKKSGKFWYSVSAQEKSTDLTDYFQASSLSNEIELIQKPLLYAPNAFTINNDGVNENWGLRDVFVKDLIVKIYDRWGKLVYENTDKYKQWIGQSNEDLPLPSDVYVYLVTYTGWDESIHQVKGNVTVIR